MMLLALSAAGAVGHVAVASAEDQPMGLQPPASVACADKNHCDRDGAHLGDFVVKFFAWYVDNEIDVEAQPGDAAARLKFQRDSLRPLDRLLSGRFLAKLAKLRKEIDAAPQGELPETDPSLESLCGGADADNILCAQDFDPSWRSKTVARVSAIESVSATLTVTLPQPADSKEPPHRLTVTLIPDRGYWRIDRIAGGPDK